MRRILRIFALKGMKEMRKKGIAIAGAMIALALASCSKKEPEVSPPASSPSVIRVIPAPQMQYPEVQLKIVEPREGEVFKNPRDSVRIVIQVTGIALGIRTKDDSTRGIAYAREGQHIHVIIDDRPYMANFQNGQPFNIGVLASGMHTIRAFPAFSWHESIKSPNAFATRTFYVGRAAKGKVEPANNLDGPLLTYSRPKGTYSGDEAKRILLDFYVSNAKLAPDRYRVKLWIDGKSMPDLMFWQAYYIEGLPTGEHAIKLQLTSPNGTAVPGTFNSPSETISIQ